MAVVLDPRMRRLYAKMMECRTVEDLGDFHEQLYYQYGKKQVREFLDELAGADDPSQLFCASDSISLQGATEPFIKAPL